MTLSIGVDPSLTSTGILIWNGKRVVEWINPKTSPDMELAARINHLRRGLARTIKDRQITIGAIEEIAFSRGGHGQIVQLAKVSGVLENTLYRAHIPTEPVVSGTWKKDMLGNGSATKPEYLAAARQIWPECPNDDMAAALHIAMWSHNRLNLLESDE